MATGDVGGMGPGPVPRPSADGLRPHQRSLMELPNYVGVPARLRDALVAVAGRARAADGELTEPGAVVSRSRLTVADRGSALERLRRSWRGSAYLHLLDEAIRAPQLRRCVTIAVVSRQLAAVLAVAWPDVGTST